LANWLLRKIDDNMTSVNKVIVVAMTVHTRRASRTIKMKVWVEGTEKSFSEVLAPARDLGTKMLKLGDELWTYTPATDRIIKIAGHMLRQSLMGSDLSYGDMMEDPKLSNLYTSKVVGEETILDRPSWVLELAARSENVAYQSRKLWVDQERYTIVREDRYAKSGELLKTTEALEFTRVDNRWVTSKAIFRDVLKGGDGTEFVIESIRFNAEIPAYLFTKAALKE
jgi:outer membrane lipoprotein-sorting protein